ncbi:hypothetical protein ACQ4WX_41385 [Streptomyces lasalocidi]
MNSTPAGLSLGEADHAKRAAERFLSRLGTNPRDAPVSDILGAQSAVAREAAGEARAQLRPPFVPVAGVGPLPDRAAWTDVVTRRAPGPDVTIGITERETVAFHAMNPVPRRVREVPVPGSACAADGVELAAREFARPSRKLDRPAQ